MKRSISNSLRAAVLLLFFFAAFYSCKKVDTPNAKQLYAAKFFEKPAASSAELNTIIDLLKNENDKTGFVNILPGNAGLPVWSKTIAQKPAANYAARGVLVDQNGNYLIPLSNDQKTLSALLFAMKKDGNYEFYCYDNNYAYQIAFSDQYSIQQRENIMGLFISINNYVFGITHFRSIPKELFVGMNGEKIEAGGMTKQMFLEPPKGVPPIILNSLGVIGTEETCVYKFSGQCNCGPDVVTNASHCNDWQNGCPFCSVSDCQLLIFEEVPGTEPPPTNPNGGMGQEPSNSYSPWGEGQNLAGGPLTPPTNGSLPNAPCSNNCAWYTEAPEQNFQQYCGPDGMVVDNECVSPSNYPGKEEGYPYRWWENSFG